MRIGKGLSVNCKYKKDARKNKKNTGVGQPQGGGGGEKGP